VSYAGGAPYLVTGAFQANVQIPALAAAGEAEAYITVGGVDSNHVTLFIR
jgi:uncharacterized protein (TIGR03437 family)